MIQTALALLLGTLTVSWVVFIGPLCWILRDGLGPNAVDSEGWHAVGRFLMTFYFGPVAAGLALATIACALWAAFGHTGGKPLNSRVESTD